MTRAKAIAVLQSNYIPWKGYFDIVAAVDAFLIFDDAQFTRRDWRNRNKIIINGKPHWLTIPVASKGQFEAPIREIEVSDTSWAEKHWRSIANAYAKAPFFSLYAPVLQQAYEQAAELRQLTEINELLLRRIARVLDLTTTFERTETVPRQAATPTGRLVEICVANHASVYISGPAARDYIETEQFDRAGIALRYADYSGYPVYEQNAEPFEHGVSIIDLLMRCGPDARSHLKSVHRPGSLLEAI